MGEEKLRRRMMGADRSTQQLTTTHENVSEHERDKNFSQVSKQVVVLVFLEKSAAVWIRVDVLIPQVLLDIRDSVLVAVVGFVWAEFTSFFFLSCLG